MTYTLHSSSDASARKGSLIVVEPVEPRVGTHRFVIFVRSASAYWVDMVVSLNEDGEDELTLLFDLTHKWDECSHLTLGGSYIHFCDDHDVFTLLSDASAVAASVGHALMDSETKKEWNGSSLYDDGMFDHVAFTALPKNYMTRDATDEEQTEWLREFGESK